LHVAYDAVILDGLKSHVLGTLYGKIIDSSRLG
jgi:hypothetical protein